MISQLLFHLFLLYPTLILQYLQLPLFSPASFSCFSPSLFSFSSFSPSIYSSLSPSTPSSFPNPPPLSKDKQRVSVTV